MKATVIDKPRAAPPASARHAGKRRCGWARSADADYVRYHDEEWGRPVHDDRLLFEMLTLEGAQAGLSWSTIRRACAGWSTRTVPPAQARRLPPRVRRLRAAQGGALRCTPPHRPAARCRHRAQPLEDRVHREQRAGVPRAAARVRLL